jgi:hypothetical protein
MSLLFSDQPQELARPTTRAGGARYIQSAAVDDEDDLTDRRERHGATGTSSSVFHTRYHASTVRQIFSGKFTLIKINKKKNKMRTAEVSNLEIIPNFILFKGSDGKVSPVPEITNFGI